MMLPTSNRRCPRTRNRRDVVASGEGSVLIIVLWVAFGLVSLALYFASSMTFELRAADNRVASIEAGQAIAGAARYVSNILATAQVPGTLPDRTTYLYEAVPVDDTYFWLIGRPDQQVAQDEPVFGLVDEASKLNLNTATLEMLEMLPNMTPELAAAIIDWRDSDSDPSDGGAESDLYERLNPPYRCKNANFESVDELRLVYGMNLDYLFGEDANLNGVLDPNEGDGDLSPPNDNSDGWLNAGLLEYVTVYSAEPTTRTNGEPRINVNSTNQQDLATLLQDTFGADRANQILQQLGVPGGDGGAGNVGGNQDQPDGGGNASGTSNSIGSVLEFYMKSGMTSDEFAQIEYDITASTNSPVAGLVNVNTASEAVLACIPGIGLENAGTLVAHRLANQASLSYAPSLAWVAEVLEGTNALQAGPYLTGHSYQFTADIAAVGHYGRGYQRVRYVFDTSDGMPRIVYRQDLTHLGWALGREVRDDLKLLANNQR